MLLYFGLEAVLSSPLKEVILRYNFIKNKEEALS